ncbi:MAG TPA: hypothetical protein VJC13_03330 [Candidatus Paceibacterota bacterium]
MSTRILRFRKVNKADFERLRNGIKSVETRAASLKYRSLEEGDILIFVCGKDKFSKIIKKKYHFKSIDAMFKKIPFKKIWPEVKSAKEPEKIYYSYPNYEEKIKNFGILAFKLK